MDKFKKPSSTERKASVRYLNMLGHFCSLVQKAQEKTVGSKDFNVMVSQGSTWDAIVLTTAIRGTTRQATLDVLYFVHKDHELIFASRSKIAPNFTRYYGTLRTVNYIDWDAASPRVKEGMESKARLKVVRTYGEAVHYIPSDPTTLEVFNRVTGKA